MHAAVRVFKSQPLSHPSNYQNFSVAIRFFKGVFAGSTISEKQMELIISVISE